MVASGGAETRMGAMNLLGKPSRGSKRRVLIVDDQPIYRRMLSVELEREGFAVAVASNGTQGVVQADIFGPDLVIMDITMPGIDGFEAMRRMLMWPHLRHIPVIVLSASSKSDDVMRAVAYGAVDYLSKPFKMGTIAKRVKEHLSIV